MIRGLTFLASIGTAGEGFGDFFAQLESLGVFKYLLPFLLIFALVFGILTKVKLFKENKAINAIIALVVSLMAVQMDFVTDFFTQILPRMGVALIIILVFFIIVGLFTDPNHPIINWILFGIAAVVFAIVLIKTSGALGLSSGTWWKENGGMIVIAGVFIAIVIAVIASASSKKGVPLENPVWTRDASK